MKINNLCLYSFSSTFSRKRKPQYVILLAKTIFNYKNKQTSFRIAYKWSFFESNVIIRRPSRKIFVSLLFEKRALKPIVFLNYLNLFLSFFLQSISILFLNYPSVLSSFLSLYCSLLCSLYLPSANHHNLLGVEDDAVETHDIVMLHAMHDGSLWEKGGLVGEQFLAADTLHCDLRMSPLLLILLVNCVTPWGCFLIVLVLRAPLLSLISIV